MWLGLSTCIRGPPLATRTSTLGRRPRPPLRCPLAQTEAFVRDSREQVTDKAAAERSYSELLRHRHRSVPELAPQPARARTPRRARPADSRSRTHRVRPRTRSLPEPDVPDHGLSGPALSVAEIGPASRHGRRQPRRRPCRRLPGQSLELSLTGGIGTALAINIYGSSGSSEPGTDGQRLVVVKFP